MTYKIFTDGTCQMRTFINNDDMCVIGIHRDDDEYSRVSIVLDFDDLTDLISELVKIKEEMENG